MPTIQDLEVQFKEAQAATEAYSASITEKYRQEMPGTDDATILARARAWTDDERAELARLQDVATELVVELHRAREAAKREGDNY
ncbi:hypothetical protein DN069_35245 [Streptacidiphilus pinicola]|uniref:Uncharacterized protein n=1 Tax=Streptacidiphilus pinicola TaxID=2219663 RepID=A0A2X0IBH7_9ACTN|nr:hypothetical protein [Streptacidiphilus pinicola]RAG80973.1 hypothetical protein DN069_35245 [Streptacidiphilus pinicola]